MPKSIIFLIYFCLMINLAHLLPTCDFDLDNIEEILQYLPEDCQKIQKRDPKLYADSFAESTKFKEFAAKLKEIEENQTLKQNWTLRAEIYGNVSIYECSNIKSNHTKYYKCLSDERDKMISLLNQHN